MGTIIHRAVVVTASDVVIENIFARAVSLGLTVIGPSEKVTNWYRSLLVCPCGSKEGWDTAIDYQRRRGIFVEYLRELGAEYAEVQFGYDEPNPGIISAING